MKGVVIVLFVEAIPISVLIAAVFPIRQPDAAFSWPGRRRSRFWLRFVGVVIAIMLPVLVVVFAPGGEQTAGPMLFSGLAWGMLLAVLARFVLFNGSESDPGSADEDDGGPGPGDGRPDPPAPIGGIPLPDAEPASTRVRDHRPPRSAPRHRRPVRDRERVLLRLWRAWGRSPTPTRSGLTLRPHQIEHSRGQ